MPVRALRVSLFAVAPHQIGKQQHKPARIGSLPIGPFPGSYETPQRVACGSCLTSPRHECKHTPAEVFTGVCDVSFGCRD